MKKTIEMIKQNTYERKSLKNSIPKALIASREKRRTDTKNGTIRNETQKQNDKRQILQILKRTKLEANP